MIRDIKTIIFDLGGVLMDLDKQRCIDAFRTLGFYDIDEYLGQYSQKGCFMELEDGRISAAQFREAVRKHIGKPVTDARIDEAFNAFLVNVPDYKLTMLLELRKKYQLFMLSNTNPVMFGSRIREIFSSQGLSIEDYFDRFYLSYEMGVTKPDPRIFEMLIRDSGICPGQTLFFDDSRKNLEAAEPFGLKTYLVSPGEDFRALFGL